MFGRMGKKPTYNSFFVIWWIFFVTFWSMFGHSGATFSKIWKISKNTPKNIEKWQKMTKNVNAFRKKMKIFATCKIVILFVMFAVIFVIFVSFFVRCISNFSKWHKNEKKMTNKTTDQNSNNKQNIKNDKQNDRPKLKWQKMTKHDKQNDRQNWNDKNNDRQNWNDKKKQQTRQKNDKLNILNCSTFASLSFSFF